MPAIQSELDVNGEDFARNREAMLAAVAGFRELEQKVLDKAAEARPKFEKRGQLLPRERLALLLDPGAPFLELSSLAGYKLHDDKDGTQAGGGIIAGIGYIAGVRCLVSASNSAIKGGTISPTGLKKTLRLQQIAMENKLPVVTLTESGGANLNYAAEIFVEGARGFANQARISAMGIPQVTVVHGSSTAGGAYQPGLSDYVVVVRGKAKMFLAGPPLLKAATGEIASDGDDEPAQLMKAMRSMQASLHDTIEQIGDSAALLAAAAEQLNAVTEEGNRSLARQNDEIEMAATAVNEMSAAVEEVARNASSTAEASSLSERAAGNGRARVGQTVRSIRQMNAEIGQTARLVEGLASQAQDIGKVLDVIRAIAEQTNLLALNAAIEAARAGEQGRGFAVVADEVRALAHRTQQSTHEIEGMIASVREGTDTAVSAMRENDQRARQMLDEAEAADHALGEIAEHATRINERTLVIASAAEEQAHVAREVDRNLVNIRDVAVQTTQGAEQTRGASHELSRLANDLKGMIGRFVV